MAAVGSARVLLQAQAAKPERLALLVRVAPVVWGV
jgi:hypothetical protein